MHHILSIAHKTISLYHYIKITSTLDSRFLIYTLSTSWDGTDLPSYIYILKPIISSIVRTYPTFPQWYNEYEIISNNKKIRMLQKCQLTNTTQLLNTQDLSSIIILKFIHSPFELILCLSTQAPHPSSFTTHLCTLHQWPHLLQSNINKKHHAA